MRKLFKWNERWIFYLVNNQVDTFKFKNIDEVKHNHKVKTLIAFIETYQAVIYNLLENQWKNDTTEQ